MNGARLGTVVIGRNEGARLERCLKSIPDAAKPVVYVDSASSDGSVEMARSLGAEVVELDPARPFNAARARGEGYDRLREIAPDVELVQFVDGDCEIVDGWVEAGLAALDQYPKAGVVCGRRRERFPEAHPYNALADLEWNTPVGEAAACGGDSIVRVSAYEEAGGFDPWIIANEEPDLCRRIREKGFTVRRIDADMTVHDAALSKMSQLWRRGRRGGFGFAQYIAKTGDRSGPEAGSLRRAFFWGLALPVLTLIAASFWTPSLLVGLAIYSLQWLRMFMQRGDLPARLRVARANMLLLTKPAEALGALQFYAKRASGKRMDAILYK